MFSVYILYSRSRKQFYVGVTSDLEERLRRHNVGRSKATKPGIPWELVFVERFVTRGQAVVREREIKAWKSADRIRKLVEERPASAGQDVRGSNAIFSITNLDNSKRFATPWRRLASRYRLKVLVKP